MRKITLIIVHCSAVRPYQTSTARQIDQWHKARGWKGIGYHYVILRDGKVETGRKETEVGAHCAGHNKYSIGICYEGGLDANGNAKDTRTYAQKRAMRSLLSELKTRYPNAVVTSHHTFSPTKACPCFDAEHEYGRM